jgi:Na+-transporting methylmalonyl-CoA/oxaloacetate decarboxylase gamma subunit
MFENVDLNNIIKGDGILISVVGYVVVFVALFLLFIFISNLKNVLNFLQRKKLREEGHHAAEFEDLDISGEINAAIATALYLYMEEAHDIENAVLTIKRIKKDYSPWSSKLYGLRQFPRK